MKMSVPIRLLILLIAALAAVHSYAQDAVEESPVQSLMLSSLESDWWSFFNRSGEDARGEIEQFFKQSASRVADLKVANRAVGQSILDAVRDNVRVYLELTNEPELKAHELPEAAVSYTFDELLELAAQSRAAHVDATEELLDVEREQRTLAGAIRRRDLSFKAYINATAGDEKVLAALTLIQNRSAQAIAARRLEVLTQRYEIAAAYAEARAERVEYAAARLASSADAAALEGLKQQIVDQESVVIQQREALRSAELGATVLDLGTAQGRSEQELKQEEVLLAAVNLALAELEMEELQARTWWTELKLEAVPDMANLQAQALEWSELMRRVELDATAWRQDTENELLLVQTASRDGLDRAARRLLDQRLGTTQETLGRLGELSEAIADLKLASAVVDGTVASYSGTLSSWLTSLTRGLKTLWFRITDLGDVTLFSIGEAPVTGGDILRVLIILSVAYLLSRGVRHTISRVGRSESTGRQASLYTVGRLTHYAIIFIAFIVALSSIGLDFSSLALIAGALGVGIGFGLQSIVSNFVSGLIILFEQSLRVGDYIELDTGLTGTVKAINVRSTLINTNDNIDIVVPNSEFVTTRLTNWTLGERILRVRIPFGVAYGSDKELVRKAAVEAAAEVPYTLTHMRGREPDVWLVEFGDSSLNFLLLVWVNLQGARRPTRSRAAYLWALETKLTEYGIEIPFPQRDINLRQGWPGTSAAKIDTPQDGDMLDLKDEKS